MARPADFFEKIAGQPSDLPSEGNDELEFLRQGNEFQGRHGTEPGTPHTGQGFKSLDPARPQVNDGLEFSVNVPAPLVSKGFEQLFLDVLFPLRPFLQLLFKGTDLEGSLPGGIFRGDGRVPEDGVTIPACFIQPEDADAAACGVDELDPGESGDYGVAEAGRFAGVRGVLQVEGHPFR